ncbi:MAG: hypothetical protein IT439_05755 [Phycisphaerales bacterium]|nr:hypothetical protein [Phycisphaerales bacterium]
MPDERTPTQPLPPGAMLRCAADDELCAQRCRELEAHLAAHPHHRPCIESERALRERCREVMSSGCCPDALRARIARLCNGAGHPATVSRSFWVRPGVRRSLTALAACVAVAAGGVFVYQMSRVGTGVPASGASFEPVVNFVAEEHEACASHMEKFTIKEIEDAPPKIASILGSSPTIPSLAAVGLRFIGAGECGVPEGGRSVHLRFESDGTHCREGMPVSLFIQHASSGTPSMEPGKAYVLCSGKQGAPDAAPTGLARGARGNTIYAWRVGDLAYYLVAAEVPACEKFRAAAGLPDPVEPG